MAQCPSKREDSYICTVFRSVWQLASKGCDISLLNWQILEKADSLLCSGVCLLPYVSMVIDKKNTYMWSMCPFFFVIFFMPLSRFLWFSVCCLSLRLLFVLSAYSNFPFLYLCLFIFLSACVYVSWSMWCLSLYFHLISDLLSLSTSWHIWPLAAHLSESSFALSLYLPPSVFWIFAHSIRLHSIIQPSSLCLLFFQLVVSLLSDVFAAQLSSTRLCGIKSACSQDELYKSTELIGAMYDYIRDCFDKEAASNCKDMFLSECVLQCESCKITIKSQCQVIFCPSLLHWKNHCCLCVCVLALPPH